MEAHLTRIYRKLHVRSRTELAPPACSSERLHRAEHGTRLVGKPRSRRRPTPCSMGAMDDLRHHVIGVDEMVPTLDGSMVRYVNLDNAATTPAMRAAHGRGGVRPPVLRQRPPRRGHKARVCTAAYERARSSIEAFVGADPDRDAVIFTKNTTEAINKLARSTAVDDDAVVLTTLFEHHSNDLPWRARVRTVHVGVLADGTARSRGSRPTPRPPRRPHRVLVVSGASNVTGVIPPIHDLAARVHAVGGRILVDAAQLAAAPTDRHATS